MDEVLLEKPPRIAVYSPPNMQPWDDAVTLALTYAEVPYDVIYDEDVLAGHLGDYDWLHLHHEDFTGQYGKFYASFGLEPWYLEQKHFHEELAGTAGLRHGLAAEARGGPDDPRLRRRRRLPVRHVLGHRHHRHRPGLAATRHRARALRRHALSTRTTAARSTSTRPSPSRTSS